VAQVELHVEDFLRTRSRAQARSHARLLCELSSWLQPRRLEDADADAISAYLTAKLDGGAHPNTVRKWLVMLRSYYGWAYERGAVPAATLLALRAMKPPPGSSGRTRPQPYSAKEIAGLWRTLDERWPTLPAGEGGRWLARW
jgi:site-specific recombinase XerD